MVDHIYVWGTTYIGPLKVPVPKRLPIRSNRKMICLHCGMPITPENDSGWEAFTQDGATTQPVCETCDKAMDNVGEKVDNKKTDTAYEN